MRRALLGLALAALLPLGAGAQQYFPPPASSASQATASYSYPLTVIADGASAYWRLNEPSGLTFADQKDVRTATVSATTGITRVGGALADGDGAIALAGTQPRIAFTALSAPALTGGFSIEVWIRPAAGGPAYQAVLTQSTDRGIFGHTWPAKLTFATVAANPETATTLQPGVLYHVVLTVSSGAGAWYVNGVADGTFTLTTAETFQFDSFGCDSGAECVSASLFDELAFYPVALTAGQVAAHYALRNANPSATAFTQSTALTGTQNDVVLTPGATTLFCTNATLLTITGLTAGVDGQHLTIVSKGAGQVNLSPQAAGSLASARLINQATVGASPLAPGVGAARYVYDATAARWRMVDHDQGAAIAVAFAAGNFTGPVTAWTVAVGDFVNEWFYLRGRRLAMGWNLATTTVGAGNIHLRIAIPNGFLGGQTSEGGMHAAYEGVSFAPASVRVTAGDAFIQIMTFKPGESNWVATTDVTYTRGSFEFEVQ